MAVHRSVYDAVGGFRSHEHIASGDDDLLVNAAADSSNTTVCLDPETYMYSAGKTTFHDWYRQKKRHLSAGVHYRRTHQVLLALLAGTHVTHYLAVILLLFVAPVAALVLWVVRAGACVIFLRRALRVLKAGDLYPRLLLYDALTAVYYGVFAAWEVGRVWWRREEQTHRLVKLAISPYIRDPPVDTRFIAYQPSHAICPVHTRSPVEAVSQVTT
jgi:hypothetical protein